MQRRRFRRFDLRLLRLQSEHHAAGGHCAGQATRHREAPGVRHRPVRAKDTRSARQYSTPVPIAKAERFLVILFPWRSHMWSRRRFLEIVSALPVVGGFVDEAAAEAPAAARM